MIVEWDADPAETDLIGVSGAGPLQSGEFEVLLSAEFPGGLQTPSDCNQDGSLDLSDSVCLLRFLFLEAEADCRAEMGPRWTPATSLFSIAMETGTSTFRMEFVS